MEVLHATLKAGGTKVLEIFRGSGLWIQNCLVEIGQKI